MPKKLKVLISAYACEPNKGSEPEVGWQWALQMARMHEVTVLTRANNRSAIEKELALLKGSRPLPRFIYHDEKPLWLWLKRRARAVRLYYVLWQKSAQKFIKDLLAEEKFDLLHHVTFASYRYRTGIWNHGVPTLWGPVGGAESIPWALLPWKYPASLAPEFIRNINNLMAAASFGPLPKRARATTRILVCTVEMGEIFQRLGLPSTLMPTIGLNVQAMPVRTKKNVSGPLRLLFVGNVIALKGIDLALAALKESGANAQFAIVGDGIFEQALKKISGGLQLGGRVEFRGRLGRAETLAIYPGFDVFVFPSLHDTGGYAVIEAMASGLPVICLDCGGPRVAVLEGTGMRIPLGSRKEVVRGLADAIHQYDRDRTLVDKHGAAARELILREYDWEEKARQMDAIYQQAAMGKQILEVRSSKPR